MERRSRGVWRAPLWENAVIDLARSIMDGPIDTIQLQSIMERSHIARRLGRSEFVAWELG